MTAPLLPSYRLVKRDRAFEIRTYEAMVLAEVQQPGTRAEATQSGSAILRSYMQGGNASGERFALTLPVTAQPSPDRGGARGWFIRFILPSGVDIRRLPAPKDERIALFGVPVARAAVLRFSGNGRDETLKAKTAELRAWMKAESLSPSAPPTYAFYNANWTPGFMRRNEVMIGIEY